MAMLFQDNNLFPHLTAERNIALAVTQHRTLTKSTRQKILTALMRVGLEGFGDYKPGQLSGGQQSRVALARVLLQDKPIVLLDEPFNALGPALKNDMLDLLQILAHERKSLVLMVTHNPEDALRIAHETLLVSDEQVSLPVSTPDLLANPPPALATYLGKRVTVQ
jgi:thiamine transport system ATP-binding protein